MRAGFAQRDITPNRSMGMAGFDRRKDPSTGTLDPLDVCALAFEDTHGARFVMCVFDLLGTDSTLCVRIKEAVSKALGIEPVQVWVGATHTHSAPTGHIAGGQTYDETYVSFLTAQAVSAAQAAMADLREVTPAGALTYASGVASLRNRGREGSQFPMSLPLIFLSLGMISAL